MRGREDLPGMSQGGNPLLFMLGGIVIGATVGLLLAPQSGERTRRRIARTVEDTMDHVVDLRDEMTDRVEDLRRQVGRQIDAGRDYLDGKKNGLFAGLEKPLNSLSKRFG